jgi:hypothetical protein
MSLCAERSLQGESGLLFLTPQNFVDLGPDAYQRFVEYKNSHPMWDHLVPHLKTYIRLFHRPPPTMATKSKRSELSTDSSSQVAAWLFLTSACLSRGAHGNWTFGDDNPTLTMRNFEAGIMLWSTRHRYLVTTPVQRDEMESKHNGVSIYRTSFPFNAISHKSRSFYHQTKSKPFFHDSTDESLHNFEWTPPLKRQRQDDSYDERKEDQTITRAQLRDYILEHYDPKSKKVNFS